MSLYRRNGIFHIDLKSPSGERIRRSTGTDDKRKAQEIHDKIRAENWEVVYSNKRPVFTWDQAALKWLDDMSGKASIDNDKTAIRFFTKQFSGKSLEEIGRDEIEASLARLQSSEATKNRYVACIRAILNKAAGEWRWIPSSPKLKTYKEQKRRIRWITQEQAKSLIEALPKHYATVARFALATGLRMANILALSWSQIDMTRKVAWIHPDQAKSRRAIGVPLSEEAINILSSQQGKHDSLVFLNRSGRQMIRIETRPWKDACKHANIEDFRFHDLRHTWASWHVQSGTPLNVLQELGGWECSDMVRRYAHLAPEHLAKWADNVIHVTFFPQQSDSVCSEPASKTA